eukprot:COSAG01_NODE_3354_length_6215_cov_299.344016_3_plen_172_part_00
MLVDRAAAVARDELRKQTGEGFRDIAIQLGKKAARAGGDQLIGVASEKAKERLGGNPLTSMFIDKAADAARGELRAQTGDGRLGDHWHKHKTKYKTAAGLGIAALGSKKLSDGEDLVKDGGPRYTPEQTAQNEAVRSQILKDKADRDAEWARLNSLVSDPPIPPTSVGQCY